MIFAVEGHIDMIRNGLPTTEPCKPILIKTQTRRRSRGVYKIEAERKNPHKIGYTVQRKRGVKAEPDIRIVFDNIWEDFDYISVEDAWAEGGYMPTEFETLFSDISPKWKGRSRWAFKFHVVEVQK